MRSVIYAIAFLTAVAASAGTVAKKAVPVSELKQNLPFKTLVPRFAPAGFKLSKAEIISEQGESSEFSPNYSIEYCNMKKQCYTFESGSEFDDGPDSAQVKSGTSKLLGNFKVYFFPPNSEGNNSAEPYVLSTWMIKKEFSPRGYHLFGSGISLNEASKIIESLEIQ
jgi:hypothetical protein